MIYPIPPGIDPATHRCGACGSDFRMPSIEGRQTLICRKDEAHDTYQSKNKETRKLWRGDGTQAEVNILTGKETTELAPITDHATALAAVRRSITIGKFSGQQTEIQIYQIAQLALAYQLDPMMEEIIPMYGKPYITIKGRRRLDNWAGNRFGLAWKVPDREFLEYYQSMGAIDKGDVVAVAVGTYMGTDSTVEAWARCKVHEVAGNDAHLPINAWKLEMAQKRAERKLREMMFGPIPKPKGLEHIDVLQEGDESNIVDGTATLVEDTPQNDSQSLPDYGDCPIHPGKMFVTKDGGHGVLLVSHREDSLEPPWCRLATILKDQMMTAWAGGHLEEERTGKFVNDWLKETYRGKTWSKMDIPEMRDAIAKLKGVDTGTGEMPDDLEDPGPNPEDEDGHEAELEQYLQKQLPVEH